MACYQAGAGEREGDRDEDCVGEEGVGLGPGGFGEEDVCFFEKEVG